MGDEATVDWAVALRPKAGESTSGDAAFRVDDGRASLLAVVDGSGHGAQAAAAAAAACGAIAAHATEPLEDLLARCHAALQSSRGAAITLARLDTAAHTLTWLGVGNVDGCVVRRIGIRNTVAAIPRLFPGTVGYTVPRLRSSVVHVEPGDVVVLRTDGVAADAWEHIPTRQPAEWIAARIIERHAPVDDDALVAVGRLVAGGG